MKKPPEPTSVRLNLAPMVDVTMTLLVFFLMATRMVEQENSLIDLPVARAAQEAEKSELGARFVINVRQDENNPESVNYIVQDNEIPLSQLYERLKQEKHHDPDINCVIRADRMLAYRHVQAVMIGCAKAGIEKITFGATPDGPGGVQ